MGGVLGAGGAQVVQKLTLGAWEGGVCSCRVCQGSPEEHTHVCTHTRTCPHAHTHAGEESALARQRFTPELSTRKHQAFIPAGVCGSGIREF